MSGDSELAFWYTIEIDVLFGLYHLEEISMRAASGHEPPPAWWVRGCRRLWHGFLWMWGVLIVGISINVGSAWLTTATLSLTKTPLGWLLDHPALPLAVGGI